MEKQRFLAIMRKARLLGLMEHIHYQIDRWRCRHKNAVFRANHPATIMPPHWWMHDMYATASYHYYWTSGSSTAQTIASLFVKYGKGSRCRVAEWGCGMARVLRHMPSDFETVGFDYNPDAVEWCKDKLGLDCRLNSVLPPLPEIDNAFDGMYAISVFTHLSAESHEAWIDEIFRVLKPGGIFIVTFHSDEARHILLEDERTRFDRGELVVRGAVKEGSRIFTAYQPDAFVRKFVKDRFDILEGPVPSFGQSLYVLLKSAR